MFETIQKIIVDQLGIDASQVTPETHFENDLNADSLDVFQIISDIEDELDITIDTEQQIHTVGELIQYIEDNQ